jgi:hypothetical protein
MWGSVGWKGYPTWKEIFIESSLICLWGHWSYIRSYLDLTWVDRNVRLSDREARSIGKSGSKQPLKIFPEWKQSIIQASDINLHEKKLRSPVDCSRWHTPEWVGGVVWQGCFGMAATVTLRWTFKIPPTFMPDVRSRNMITSYVSLKQLYASKSSCLIMWHFVEELCTVLYIGKALVKFKNQYGTLWYNGITILLHF